MAVLLCHLMEAFVQQHACSNVRLTFDRGVVYQHGAGSLCAVDSRNRVHVELKIHMRWRIALGKIAYAS